MKRTSVILITAGPLAAGMVIAGPLPPPGGGVAPIYQTLTDIEPRITISAGSLAIRNSCSGNTVNLSL